MATTAVPTWLQRKAELVFSAADKDGNGWLSHTELKNAIRRDAALEAALVRTFHHWKDLFAALDADNDGRISLDELVRYMAHHAHVFAEATAATSEHTEAPKVATDRTTSTSSKQQDAPPMTFESEIRSILERPVTRSTDEVVELYGLGPAFGLPSLHLRTLFAHAALSLCKVPFRFVACDNEHVSPEKTLPLLRRANGTLVPTLVGILRFVAGHSSSSQKPTPVETALEHVVTVTLARIMEYDMWHCSFAEAKHVYFSSRYPAPLDTWLAQRARSNALQNLSHVLVASRISEDDLPPELELLTAQSLRSLDCQLALRTATSAETRVLDAVAAALVAFATAAPFDSLLKRQLKTFPRLLEHAKIYHV